MVVLPCVACGGGGSTANVVDGMVAGHSFAIASAASVTLTDPSGAFGAEILIGSSPDLCADFAASIVRGNSQQVALFVENHGSTATAPTTGDYLVGAVTGVAAQVLVNVNDATCNDILPMQVRGTQGTVTLTATGTDLYAGHFDVVLNTGDHLTGSFDPKPCPALLMTGQRSCM
jgi:hypothetical protein